MKLDDILENIYFKDAIHLNADKVNEEDIKNFISFIKEKTNKEMYDKIYVQDLFSLKNNHFVCANNRILNKFKIILFDDDNINIAEMDEKHQGKISIIPFRNILKMELEEVEDLVNYYYEAYRLTINMKDDSILILDTSTTISQIRKDSDKFLINLKKTFDKYNKIKCEESN